MRYFLSFIVITLLAVHSLPYLVKDQVLIWLKKQGVSAPAFKSISINYFSGEVALNQLQANQQGKPDLKVDQVRVSLSYKNLFDKQILIDNVLVKGVSLGIDKTDKGLFIGPINLDQFANKKDETTAKNQTASDWLFGLQTLNFQDLTFDVNFPPYKQQLTIQKASLKDLYQWQQQTKTSIELSGLLNSAAFSIASTAKVFPEKKTSTLALKLNNFALESITAPIIPELSARISTDLAVEIDLQGLTGSISHQGSIGLKAVSWKDKQQQLQLKAFDWQGKGQIALDSAQPNAIAVEGKLTLQELALHKLEKKLLAFSSFNWQGPLQTTFEKGQIQQLSIADDFSITGLDLDLDSTKASVKKLTSSANKSPVKLIFEQQALKQLTLSNKLIIDQLNLRLEQKSIALHKATMNHAKPLTLSMNSKGVSSIAGSPSLSLAGLSFKQPSLSVASKTLSVTGPIALHDLTGSPVISSSPTVKSAALKVEVDNHLIISSNAIKLSAKLAKMDVKDPKINAIQLNLDGFSLASSVGAMKIASLKQLSLSNAQYSAKSVAVDKLTAKEIKIAQRSKDAPLTRISQLNINKLKLVNQNNLAIASIDIAGTNSRLLIDESVQLPLINQLQSALAGSSNSKKSTEAGSNTSSSTFNYVISSLSLSGSNKILFEDRSIDPWFKSNIDINKLNIKNISNKNNARVPIILAATINDHSKLTLTADITPFAKSKSGQWELALNGVSMPVISPYSGKFSGYFLDSGKLSLTSKGVIKANILKGKNKVNIQQLSVRSAQSEATSKTNSSLSMPLDVAISVLEDDNGDIKLSVPVSGSLDDPNFGYSSVVEIIAKKGLKKAAFGILSKALQPYGALITIATTAIDAKDNGTFINLAPVNFSPGQDKISADMKKYLKKIASMMKQRKKLKLKICAIGVAQDQAILAPEIMEQNALLEKPLGAKKLIKSIKNKVQELATQRNKNVQKELQRLKIKNDRLFVCFAKTNFKKTKLKPTVSLGL
jgi:hypothetical protein